MRVRLDRRWLFILLLAVFAATPSPLPSPGGRGGCCAAEQGELQQQAFRAAVARVAPSVLRIETIGGMERIEDVLLGTGPTTGLVLTADGYIVSSAFNFVRRPSSILVQLADGSRKPAKLVATDRNRMIALLKIEPDKPLAVPEFAPEAEIRVGQWAIAVGRTFESRDPNMAVGIVSAVRRIWGKAIQTDAAVSPNNYGGPLVDLRGRVLGVLVPLGPEEGSEMAGIEWYDSGIGFAVPAEAVQRLLPRLKQGKDLHPGLLGVQLARQSIFTGDARLEGVRPRSPAAAAGWKAGDRIVEIDGRKIDLVAQLKQELGSRYAGDTLRVAVLRDGKRIESQVELVEKLEAYGTPFLGILPIRAVAADESAATKPADDAKPAKERPLIPGPSPVKRERGAEDRDAAPADDAKPAKERPLTPGPSPVKRERGGQAAGVTVRYVYPESPAAKADLRAGDAIVSAGDKPVADAAALRKLLGSYAPGDKLRLGVRRGQQKLDVEALLGALPEGLPPADLPPAHPPAGPAEKQPPRVGKITGKQAGLSGDAVVYVPEGYSAAIGCGVVVYLAGRHAPKPDELVAQWKPLCDRHELILVAPKPKDPNRWEASELRVAPRLVLELRKSYMIDPSRVALYAGSGGWNCFQLGLSARSVFRGLVALDAVLRGAPPACDPTQPLAIYLARSGSRSPAAAERVAAALRGQKYPVTVKQLAPPPGPLAPEDLAEIARWIDALDRI